MHKRHGQSFTEYALVLAIVMAVLTGMRLYMQRGIQAAIKLSADELANQEESVEFHPLKGRLESSIRVVTEDSTQRFNKVGWQEKVRRTSEGETVNIMGFEPEEVAE